MLRGESLWRDVDAVIGQALRRWRIGLGFCPDELARAVGLGPDDYDACERGEKVLDARRLATLGAVMDIPVSCFLEGLEAPGSVGHGFDEAWTAEFMFLLGRPDGEKLANAFLQLRRRSSVLTGARYRRAGAGSASLGAAGQGAGVKPTPAQ